MLGIYPQDDHKDAYYCRECGLLRIERYPYLRTVHGAFGTYVQSYRLYGTQSLTHLDEMRCLCGGSCNHLGLTGMKNYLRINQYPVRDVLSTSFPKEGEELTVTYRVEQLTDHGTYGSLVGKWVIREVYPQIASTAIIRRRKGVGTYLLYKDELQAQAKLKAFPGSRTLRYCEGRWMVLT